MFRGWDWICPGRVIEASGFGDADAVASRGAVASEPRGVVADDAEEQRSAHDAEAYPRRHAAARGADVPLVREWVMPSLDVLSRVHDVDTGEGVVRFAGCGRRVRQLYSPVRAFSLLDFECVQ